MRRDTFKCSKLASFSQKNLFLSDNNAKNSYLLHLLERCIDFTVFCTFFTQKGIFS